MQSAILFYQSVCLSNAGTAVSKRIDRLSHFLTFWWGIILVNYGPHRCYKIPRRPVAGALNIRGGNFFLQISPFISETVRNGAIGIVIYRANRKS